MKKKYFIQGDFPDGYAPNFTMSLFNRAEHRLLQSEKNWVSYYILNENSRKIEGVFNVHINGSVATSPYRAPFGAIEFSESLSPCILFDFIHFIDRSLMDLGVKEIKIKMPPLAYSPLAISLMQVLLIDKKFQIETAEAGAVIQVGNKEFKNIIKNTERHVLNRYHKMGYVCKQVAIEKLDEVYAFISKHKLLKGHTISMSFEQLQKTIEVCRNDYFLFVVMDQQQIIAASVSIKVNDHVLYNFYVTHDVVYNRCSPVIAIIETLYNFCKENSIPILDLGTSMLSDQPNFSLLNFKLRIGGVVTEKLTFSKKYT